MTPGVALILKTSLDLGCFLPLSREVLGYSPAKAADAMTVPLSDIPHQLACMSAFKDEKAPTSVRWAEPHLGMFVVGFLVVADEWTMLDILAWAAGMEVAITETKQRGIQAAIITGTLVQWQRTVRLACRNNNQQPEVRCVFNAVYRKLVDEGLRDMFDGLRLSEQSDQTFLLLEDHR
jgi:hypothetical protein